MRNMYIFIIIRKKNSSFQIINHMEMCIICFLQIYLFHLEKKHRANFLIMIIITIIYLSECGIKYTIKKKLPTKNICYIEIIFIYKIIIYSH